MKRKVLFLLLPLVVMVPAIGKADPVNLCHQPGIHPTVQECLDDANSITPDKVNHPYLVKKEPIALMAYPLKYLTHTGAYAGGQPVVTANTQSTAASGGCDYAPPTPQSCHEYWAAAKWKSPPDGGSCCTYQIEWKLYFWTDANNKNVTSVYVKCIDHPQNGFAVERSCSTSWDPYANPNVGWYANYHYIFRACPYGPTVYMDDDIEAQAHANRSITGTWYHYEQPTYC
jgi:hypothetical protein